MITINDYLTCYSIQIGNAQLFIYKRAWRIPHWDWEADGAFCIVTPWFMLYPW